MDKTLIKLLVVDDDEEDFLIVSELLGKVKNTRYELSWAPTYEAGLELIDESDFSAILVDYNLQQRDGLEFIREVKDMNDQIPAILLTGQGNYEIDLLAMKAGADDFLMKKEINPPLLERSIRYAIEHKQTEYRLRQEAERASLLADLTREFTEAGFDASAMVATIARRISETFGDAVVIRTHPSENKFLRPGAAYHPDPEMRKGLNDLMIQIRKPAGNGRHKLKIKIRQLPLIFDTDALDMVNMVRKEFAPWLRLHPVDDMLVLPLWSHNRLTGTLTIMRPTPAGRIAPEDQAFYQDLASRAALAIENARLHTEVEHLAVRDSLTGFYNRRGFMPLGLSEVEQHRRNGAPLAILMLDIDFFKDVNDTYGHEFGDEILKRLKDCCERTIRKTDIACRYGGDEFIILLPRTGLSKARRVADRIRDDFAAKTQMPGRPEGHLTLSIGICKASEEICNLEELVRKADQALYQSKQKGRNRVEVL